MLSGWCGFLVNIVSKSNLENLTLTLPEINCTNFFTRSLSFALSYHAIPYYNLDPFSQKFIPKDKAGDPYEKESRVKNGSVGPVIIHFLFHCEHPH